MNRRQFTIAVSAVAVMFATLGFINRRPEPGTFEWRVRAAGDPDYRFLVAVIYEVSTSKAKFIAIQKTNVKVRDSLLEPQFCEVRFIDGNPVMYVEGRELNADADLVASFGDGETGPSTIILDRDKYDAITGVVIMPRKDKDLWELCVETAQQSQ